MPKLVLAGVLFLHGVSDNGFCDLIVDVIAPILRMRVKTLRLATFGITPVENASAPGKSSTTDTERDRSEHHFSLERWAYKCYAPSQPELSILKITLALHTQLEWHSHPMPGAAYIVAGELTLERKRDGK